MPHIPLRQDLFGITSLLDYRKEAAKPLCALTQTLLRGPSTLTEADRELIATYVSSLNNCVFCSNAHSAATCLLPGGNETGVYPLRTNPDEWDLSPKMKSLLKIASGVQQGGKFVLQSDIDLARAHAATDLEIHDTILIAALFCLYNRYVDGLATQLPGGDDFYKNLGKRITTRGYTMPEDGYQSQNKSAY